MKLWLCSAVSDDCEPINLFVARTKEEAKEKFRKQLDDDGIWYASVFADEVSEVDGYNIQVRQKITEQDMFDSMG